MLLLLTAMWLCACGGSPRTDLGTGPPTWYPETRMPTVGERVLSRQLVATKGEVVKTGGETEIGDFFSEGGADDIRTIIASNLHPGEVKAVDGYRVLLDDEWVDWREVSEWTPY